MSGPPLFAAERASYSVAKLYLLKGEKVELSCTAFVFGFPRPGGRIFPLLVTNRHCVMDGYEYAAMFASMLPDGRPNDESGVIAYLGEAGTQWIGHPDPEVDLAVLPLAPLITKLDERKTPVYLCALEPQDIPSPERIAEFSAVENIVAMGHPSGYVDPTAARPCTIAGVTAMHPARSYAGKRELLINVRCVGGSSGSPVFLSNPTGQYLKRDGTFAHGDPQMQLLGIIRAEPGANSTERVAISVCIAIKAERLLEFAPLIAARFPPSASEASA